MLHILTVIGARPQIIKAAALSRAIRLHFADKIRETIVHTGQHYDDNMSQIFFDELGIPPEDYNMELGIGSDKNDGEKQIAEMAVHLENLMKTEKPDAIVVYGDTNSTKAGAMAGFNSHIPVVHIEAGMRSFNLDMPEEVNRIYCDQVSTLLFSPTKTGYDNLVKEEIVSTGRTLKASLKNPMIYHCGDVMYDNSMYFAEIANRKPQFLKEINLQPGNFFLATIHRNFNTDNSERLSNILETLEKISVEHKTPVVIPLHPRTRKQIDLLPELKKSISGNKNIRIIPPASYLEMITLEKNAKLILTDSGGVQKEAYYFQKPCVILRPETEWVELVESGAAILADVDPDKIQGAVRALLQKEIEYPPIFGDGHAAEFICSEMIRHLSK
jgi:UDP-GlcNAc3NAcA epimerase